ncbi:uncharacterized protein LOC143366134 isoform X3 [Andrena cerasifolii]|uniref:uncharacterized protein LOC143366134 isoform X3 n=1 Tax=Andrena cerasifolii TaxID=2819439 RepID=UPI004037BCB7
MAGRGFCVKVQLDLHAITCPGVWLCPNGKVALRMTSLGSTLESHRVSPIFPLLFHNQFTFKKTFTRLAGGLTELQRSLEQEFLYAELIQWLSPCNRAIVLASFETNLADVLYPVPNYKGLLAGVDVDLLMDPGKYFPGIIAPKIEISTKTVIEEVVGVCAEKVSGAYVVNPKTINSQRTPCAHRRRPVQGIIRQRRVCHSRAKPRVQICRPTRYRCNVENSCPGQDSRLNLCYHPSKPRPKCLRDINAKQTHYPVPSTCQDTHIFDSCPVCSKYKCYFSCECSVLNDQRPIDRDLDRRDEYLEDVESADRAGHLLDNCRCCICATMQREARYLREKFYYTDKDCKAKAVRYSLRAR